MPAWWLTCDSMCRQVVVITGDNKLTAEAICRKIGVFGEAEQDLEARSLTGRQFVELPLEQRRAILDVSINPPFSGSLHALFCERLIVYLPAGYNLFIIFKVGTV